MNRFHVSLIVDTGNEFPEVFEEISGLKATKMERKGDPFVNQRGIIIPEKLYTDNIFRYTYPDSYFDDCEYQNHCIVKILNFIEEKNDLKMALKKYSNALIIITGFYSHDDRPFLLLENELIHRMNELKIPFSIDSYK
jgi:hypothetical protein